MKHNKLEDLIQPVKADLDQFDRRLAEILTGDSPLISSIARHLVDNRGKRIRPAFLFLLARASDLYHEQGINASLAIELIHTATLLHDDVVDNSNFRRGQETVNYKWTNLISVLMGDYLFAKAFRLMVETGSIPLVEAISRATERVSVGELRQVEETSNFDLSEDEYLKIIADKTASLFAVSCEAVPILAGMNGDARRRFSHFGESIGTAFQIADDLLDYTGDIKVTGKEPGNDIITGKVTLPLIYTLRQSDRKCRKEILDILGNGVGEGGFRRILKYVSDSGGLEYTARRAAEIAEDGALAIKNLGDSVYQASLISLVEFSITRVS